MATVQEKSAVDFFLDQLIGGRVAIRLLNSTCYWVGEIAGKTHFAFLGCELDTAALSKNFLKPLDNQIYIIKATASWLAFGEKCWHKVDRSDIGTVLRAVQHAIRTISGSAAGLRCLAEFGFVFLSPYVRTLSLVKNSFAVGAGFLEVASRVHDLWKISRSSFENDDQLRNQQLKWLSDVLMIVIQIFSIQLNFFGGCCIVFKDEINPEDRMLRILFNFWGTNASLAALGYSAIEYIRSPS